MRPFLRNGQPGPLRENNGPLKLRFCQSQSAISPEVMLAYNKTGLLINFLYFVIFLMISQISFRFHALPELSQHRPSCSLENQVGLKLQSICERGSNSINQLIIDHAFYFRTMLRHIKQVSYYS